MGGEENSDSENLHVFWEKHKTKALQPKRVLAPGIVPTGKKPYIRYTDGKDVWYVHGNESVWELPENGYISDTVQKGGSRLRRSMRYRRSRLKRKTSKR